MQLDAADRTLIRELYGWDADNYPRGLLRVSVPALARRTKLHAKTIRARLKALRAGGVLDGPYFEPRPAALGLQMSGYMFDLPRTGNAEQMEARLASAPYVFTVVFGTTFAYVIFWHEDRREPPAAVEQLQRLLGASSHWKSFSSTDFPAQPAPSLSALDWRLVLALRKPPATSLARVAQSLGVTPRTAERRGTRLVQTGAATMQARYRPSRMEGTLYVHYVIHEGGPQGAASLAKAFPDRITGPFGPPFRSNVGVAVANLEEAERRRAEAEGMPGIKQLGMYLIRDWIYPKAFDIWLAGLVAKCTPGVRQP